jgi:hypothetical protein
MRQKNEVIEVVTEKKVVTKRVSGGNPSHDSGIVVAKWEFKDKFGVSLGNSVWGFHSKTFPNDPERHTKAKNLLKNFAHGSR